MMQCFRLAFRSVLRNWRHSLASILSITLGFVAIAALQGYYQDSLDKFSDAYVHRNMTGHIIIDRKETDSVLLSETEIKAIEGILSRLGSHIDRRIRFLKVEGVIAGKGPSFTFGGLGYDVWEGELVRGKKWAWNALYGVPLDRKLSNQIVVGPGLAELLGCPLSGLSPTLNDDGSIARSLLDLECLNSSYQLTALTENNKMNAADVVLKGVVDAGVRDLEDSWIMMPIAEAQTLMNTEKLSMIGVHIQNPEEIFWIRDQIRDALKEFPLISVTRWQDHPLAEIYRTMKDVMQNMQIFMLTVVLLVSVLSIINTVIRSVDERQAEIGTLRAVGYRNRFLTHLFGWEGALLGLIGSLGGVFVVVIVAKCVEFLRILYHPAVLSQKVPLRIAIVPEFYGYLSVGLIIGAALVSMIVARLKISRDIAAILRNQA